MGGGVSQVQPIQPQPQPPSNPPENVPINKNSKQKTTTKRESKKVRYKGSLKKLQNNADIRQQDSQPDQIKPEQIIFKTTPRCINNKPSTHLCLSKKCKEYPFFCMNCEGSCNEIHIHNDRQLSASLKEFQNRVRSRKQLGKTLKQSVQDYKQALLDLKNIFQEFFNKQIETIHKIEYEKQPLPRAIMLKRRLDKGEKKGITGQHIAELWNEQGDKWEQEQQKWVISLNQKEEQLISMCECFLNINDIKTEQQQQNEESQNPPPIQKKKQQKAWHFYKRYQFDKDKLSVSKENCWSNAKRPISQNH